MRTAKDDVIVFCSNAPMERQQTLEAMGVRVERLESDKPTGPAWTRVLLENPRPGELPLDLVLKRLAEMDVISVMLESGAQLNSSALAGGHVDKLTLFYAPVFLGGAGVPMTQGSVTGLVIAGTPTITLIGHDLRVDAYLRNPWE